MKNYTLSLITALFLFCLNLPTQAQILPCTFTAQLNPNHTGTVAFYTSPAAGHIVVWDLGDSTHATGPQITYTYNSTGPFNVCASQIDSNGTVLCTYCEWVYPFGNPVSCSYNFTNDPTDSLGIIFAATPGPHISVSWDFGDGTTGSGDNINHHFPQAGTYQVCMTVLDSSTGAGQTCTSCLPVVVSGSGSALCSFTSSTSPAGSGVITFHSNTMPGSTINWSFGDGTAGHGQTVTHTYNGFGTYIVCMNELDSSGNIVCTFCDSVSINNIPNNCQFTLSPSAANYMEILFSAQSPAGTNMTWDFGDGLTGTGNNVSHVYVIDGIYNVCNTLYDSAQNVLCHSCQTVTIQNPIHYPCHANFQAISLGLTGHFIDLSNIDPATASYSWDFGDGHSSSVRFPQHAYAAPGTYNVCLDIADSNCTDQYCTSLLVDTTINNPIFCNAFFVTIQMAPFQLVVVNMSSGINLNFHWDFGDGVTSNLAYPNHTYASTGSYILCLTVTNPVTGASCTSTYCDTVSVDSSGYIYRLTNAGFTINVLSPDQLTGINDVHETQFVSVYPNPVQDLLTIEVQSKGESIYRVFSINGAEIENGKFYSAKNEIKTSAWESGFYLMEITRNDGAKNYQKIIKE